jgi:hypothetical protein
METTGRCLLFFLKFEFSICSYFVFLKLFNASMLLSCMNVKKLVCPALMVGLVSGIVGSYGVILNHDVYAHKIQKTEDGSVIETRPEGLYGHMRTIVREDGSATHTTTRVSFGQQYLFRTRSVTFDKTGHLVDGRKTVDMDWRSDVEDFELSTNPTREYLNDAWHYISGLRKTMASSEEHNLLL